jgi:hypothetical protein
MPFDSATMAWVPDQPKRRKRRFDPIVEFDDGPVTYEDEKTEDLDDLVASLTVAEVTELAESGMAELDQIIEAERRGKGRKSVLALVKSESGKVYARYNEDSNSEHAE